MFVSKPRRWTWIAFHMTLNDTTTRQKILDGAAEIFAEKGFTETSIRELADKVGMNAASLYYHFPSKNAILEQMLEDYSEGNIYVYDEQKITGILLADHTTDGILKCMQTTFPPGRAEYFLRVLCVMMHEQLRNPIVRSYMSEHIILRAEKKVETIIGVLKKLGVVRQDTEPDYWMKITSSLSYTFALRMMLGIGDRSHEFSGRGMTEMHRSTFELLLETCGTAKPECA